MELPLPHSRGPTWREPKFENATPLAINVSSPTQSTSYALEDDVKRKGPSLEELVRAYFARQGFFALRGNVLPIRR